MVAFHDPQNDEVWFTYPRIGDSGLNLGVVVLKLKREAVGYKDFFAFGGVLTYPITAGLRVNKASVTVPFVFTATSLDERMFSLEGNQDDDTAFSCFFQTGLSPVGNAEVTRLLYVEPFLERGAGFGTIDVRVASSFILDDAAGTVSTPQTVDLTLSPVKTVTGFDVRARFMAIRYEWTSTSNVKYIATQIRGGEAD